MMNTLVGLRVSAESQRRSTTTELAAEAIQTVDDTQAVLQDGPGWFPERPPRIREDQPGARHAVLEAAAGADVAVVVMDATRRVQPGEWERMVPLLRAARGLLRESALGRVRREDGLEHATPRVLLAVNKVDALGKGAARAARERQALAYFAEGWEAAAVEAGLPAADGEGAPAVGALHDGAREEAGPVDAGYVLVDSFDSESESESAPDGSPSPLPLLPDHVLRAAEEIRARRAARASE